MATIKKLIFLNKNLPYGKTYVSYNNYRKRVVKRNLMVAIKTNNGEIEGIKVQKLVSEFSTPCVFVSQRVFEDRYEKLRRALDRYYPNYAIAYSFKTNNIAGVCKTFKDFGAKAEVVSGYEYFLAKKIGYKDRDIIFNGPYKKEEELLKALKEGATVNIDNADELRTVLKLTKRLKPKIKVGVRLNSKNWPSHFGFNIEDGEAFEACKEIVMNKTVILAGLQMHIGFNIEDVDEYWKEAEMISEFALLIEKNLGNKLRFFDLGGGFPAGGKPFTKESWNPPQIKDYIKTISKVVKKRYPKENVKLILEPGRYLVDEGVFLVSKVVSVRRKGKVQNVVVDTSIDHLPLATYREQEVIVLLGGMRAKKIHTTIFGATCRENDVLARNTNLPEVKAGDFIAFLSVGAYNISWQNQFCFPRPEILMIDKHKRFLNLRKREFFEDILSSQKI